MKGLGQASASWFLKNQPVKRPMLFSFMMQKPKTHVEKTEDKTEKAMKVYTDESIVHFENNPLEYRKNSTLK